MKYDIITIGGATEDLFIKTDEGVLVKNKKDLLRQELLGFEYGAKIHVESSENYFGGGASNAAIAMARLGLKTAIVAAIGKDSRGDAVLKNFKANKVGTKLIQRIKNQPTGYSVVIVAKDNEHVAFPVRGANHALCIGKNLGRSFRRASWLYVTSLSGDWPSSLADIINLKHDTYLAWNPGHQQLQAGVKKLAPYLEATTALILNLDEARELVSSDSKHKKKPKKFFDNATELAKTIFGYGPRLVVITNGAKGAVAYDGEKVNDFIPKKIKKTENTVGVGDAFGASFVAGLVIYDDILSALKLAGENAARVAASHGAQTALLYKKDLNG